PRQHMNSARQIAQSRLHPTLRDPNYLQLRARRLNFQAWVGALRGSSAAVLDVGGRLQPYRPLFSNVGRYVGVDLIRTECVNVVANGEILPLAWESFDVVITRQVLEYVREPRNAVAEILRVLKPGGTLLASFAACTPKVGEEEYWRFTAAGLRLLMAAFERIE